MYVRMYVAQFDFFIGVANLRSTSKTTNTITVVWDPADSPYCGPVLYYNVTIVNSDDVSDTSIAETIKSTIKFSNLISDTTYNISMAAVNRAGTGPTSTISVITPVVDDGGN